jgi:hypothetical protein
MVLVDPDASLPVRHLSEDVQRLQKWVSVLARCIPHGSGPTTKSGAYIPEDLHNLDLALPSHVLDKIFEANSADAKKTYGDQQVRAEVCLYCGYFHANHGGAGPSEIVLHQYKLCHGCQAVKDLSPDIFRWVSKIIQFGYVRAPAVPMPIMPPEPPPLPPLPAEAIKAITLEEA